MPIRRDVPNGLFAGVQYAYAAVADGGADVAFLAGACPIDSDGTVPTSDLEDQAALAVQNLSAALAHLGSSLSDVLRTTVYVATSSHDDLVAAWAAVRAALAPLDPPSTLVGVTVLGYLGQRLEIEAVAVVAPPPKT